MKTINGHGVAIITPFKKNGEIDFNAIPHIIEHLISGGVDFFVGSVQKARGSARCLV